MLLKIRKKQIGRMLALLLVLLAAVLPLAACDDGEVVELSVADYGSYGSDLAQQLAAKFPNRSPGSDQEKAAGDMIIKELKNLGYTPIVTTFTFEDASGNQVTSRNIAVLIEGSGFTRTSDSGKTTNLSKQVIIGTHYDTTVTAEQAAAAAATTGSSAETAATETGETTVKIPTLADCDGIHDNAAGVASLLTIAKEIKDYDFGYDVILVAFGAGTAGQAGAAFYAAQMGQDEIAATDVMYCMDSIYAGDKMYAHAGWNSALGGDLKDYEKRRKLYEVTDVFYENELYTRNHYMLYTNQSSIMLEREGFSEKVVYREWSLNESDYRPFDKLGLPVVFFESFDYDETTIAAMKESQNPAFGETGGLIRGTRFDATDYLKKLLNTARTVGTDTEQTVTVDQLTRRINNTAFILLEAVNKGMHDAVKR
jgi:alkaline phosphatase isozyme conversion protein